MRPTALLLVVAVLFTHPAHGQDFIAAADKAAPSIVTVISTNDAGTPAQVSAVTTGVIVSADGLVLASYHAVSSFEAISVRLADGAGYDAAVHGFDEFRGLALLLPPATSSASRSRPHPPFPSASSALSTAPSHP